MHNSFLMKKLFSGESTDDWYTFNQVRTWSNIIQGGVAAQDELYIPISADQTHWNFIRIKMREKVMELWDSLGERHSNSKFLRAAGLFIKDVMMRETTEGRVSAEEDW